MSSVTFLASAVVTVCVLHAVDHNMQDAFSRTDFMEVQKIELNQQLNKNNANFKLIKPAEAQALTPNASVFNAKKLDDLLPTAQEKTKNISTKSASAI